MLLHCVLWLSAYGVTLLLSSDICNTHVCLACCSCPACCLLLLPYQLLVTIASHCCLWWLPYFAACFLLLCLNVCLLLPCPVDCCFCTAVHSACCRCSVPVLVLSAICLFYAPLRSRSLWLWLPAAVWLSYMIAVLTCLTCFTLQPPNPFPLKRLWSLARPLL